MMTQNVRQSRIFIVRTWTEDRAQASIELRGMVRELQSGETRYFRNWEELVVFLSRHLDEQERGDNNKEEASGVA